MYSKIICKGNAFYEIDDVCMEKKQKLQNGNSDYYRKANTNLFKPPNFFNNKPTSK